MTKEIVMMKVADLAKLESGDFPGLKMEDIGDELNLLWEEFEDGIITEDDLHPSDVIAGGLYENLEALRESIKANGLQEPIEILNGAVIDGHHRFLAVWQLDLDEVPVTLASNGDQQVQHLK
jgi:hypothetical protein